MTSAELRIAHRGSRHGLRALEAQRMIDLLALRLAPSLAAGLIAYSHMGEVGEAADRLRLRADRDPGDRALAAAAPPDAGEPGAARARWRRSSGAAAAWLIALAAGQSVPAREFQAVVLGSWLVMALGAWVKTRVEDGLRARVAVIGPREFAADFVAELEAANVRTYEVVGWISPQGPAEYRRLRWLGHARRRPPSCRSRERIDLLVCGPDGDAEGARSRTSAPSAAEECLDLPVRLIAANQLYEETFGHVPVGMIDAAWYRYIMHPRFRAVRAALEARLRPRARRR